MRKALIAASPLWIIALATLAVNGARAMGYRVSIPAWSGFSRMFEHAWKGPAMLALAVVVTLALWKGPGATPRGTRAIGWAVGLLGVASYLFLDAPLSVALVMNGRMIHGDGVPRTRPAKVAAPGNA